MARRRRPRLGPALLLFNRIVCQELCLIDDDNDVLVASFCLACKHEKFPECNTRHKSFVALAARWTPLCVSHNKNAISQYQQSIPVAPSTTLSLSLSGPLSGSRHLLNEQRCKLKLPQHPPSRGSTLATAAAARCMDNVPMRTLRFDIIN